MKDWVVERITESDVFGVPLREKRRITRSCYLQITRRNTPATPVKTPNKKRLLKLLLEGFGDSGREVCRAIDVAPNLGTVILYCGYIAFLPAMIVAIVVFGWLIPRNR